MAVAAVAGSTKVGLATFFVLWVSCARSYSKRFEPASWESFVATPIALPIADVRLWPLTMRADPRGVFTEVFRANWGSEVQPVQWNVVSSQAHVLRGVHVHLRHWDYLLPLSGYLQLGLCDLRPTSPTFRSATLLDLRDEELTAVEIPPGVAHGFYFLCPSLHLYAVSHYWDPADELGCRWDDPGLGIPWPAAKPVLSTRDEEAGSLDALLAVLYPQPARAA